MFDIGFTELLVIAVVALVVLGPERLPKAARFAGLWVRRARAQWDSVKGELERELAAEELKRSLRQAQDAVREAGQAVQESGEALRRDVEQARKAVDETAGINPGETPSDPDAAVRPERSDEVPESTDRPSTPAPQDCAEDERHAESLSPEADAGEPDAAGSDPQAELFPPPAKSKTR
ncbi:hypothetical protein GCM10027084_26590 [Pseudoxanthomonas sangjuensis]|uniref:Sec-independent protein translocase protein TatB n=1 Tax=Pseudoxanthomonas sangjuensis TaxID=1503750 RepID=UPI001390A3F9|nr:Sec-independent protein translocase protein TatB [Pseudoxanthomonas sangjuensis]KAF1714486.1 twin-arginine translocase subunit TatB [Pseudoxanthomonas sangjuensis]